jgi:hypothetical protein
MAELVRVYVEMGGFAGGPAVNVLHFSPGIPGGANTHDQLAEQVLSDCQDVYDALKQHYLQGITVQVPQTCQFIDVATGNITDEVATALPWAPIMGTGEGANVPRGTALCAGFRTSKFINGRRLQGRAFIGPVSATQVDTAGQIAPATRAAVENSFAAPISGIGPRLAVYHRPTSKGASNGDYGDVIAVRCSSLPSNLKSRRT